MRVEEIRFPVVAVLNVNVFDICAHICGEELGYEENEKAHLKRSARYVDAGGVHRFALGRLVLIVEVILGAYLRFSVCPCGDHNS